MSAEQSDEQEVQQDVDTADEQQAHDHHGSEKAMTILAASMPWVLSLLFHLGIGLVMIFMVFMVVKTAEVEDLIIPDAVMTDDPGGRMNPNPAKTKSKSKSKTTKRKKITRKVTKVSTDTGKTKKAISLIGVAGASAASSGATDMGMRTSAGAGPRTKFFGSGGGNVYNVVYVIDGSGSMMVSGAFEFVRDELLKSIGGMRDTQTFHVILYTAGKPVEVKGKRLVLATRANKKKAAKFLAQYHGEGASNPIPALDRAFAVLKGARKPGRLIYLLSDGEFEGKGVSNDRVLRTVQARNKDKKVNINTILFGSNQPEAIAVMKKLAAENRGRYKRVDWGE